MALISGRPISFKMDLYNPLYVNRPTVEPELFASLRPPTYSGAMHGKDDLARRESKNADEKPQLSDSLKSANEASFRLRDRAAGSREEFEKAAEYGAAV